MTTWHREVKLSADWWLVVAVTFHFESPSVPVNVEVEDVLLDDDNDNAHDSFLIVFHYQYHLTPNRPNHIYIVRSI